MLSLLPLPALAAAAFAVCVLAQDKPNFEVWNLPDKSEPGQWGSNRCQSWKPSSQNSKCQNIIINHARDFCVWAPHDYSTIGDAEREVVSWCVKKGYGTRLIPDNTLTGVHFIKSKIFLQVTGYGNFRFMNIPNWDEGGELDAHGADGYGNPVGGLVFSRNIYGREGEWLQIKEWSNFMSHDEFSFRACYGPAAAKYCPHTLDEMGSRFNHPGNYDKETFDDCDSDNGPPPNIFGGREFHQGDPVTPEAHTPARTYNCRRYDHIQMGEPAKATPYRRHFHDEDEDE